MTLREVIVAIDQGSTSTKVLLVDLSGTVVARGDAAVTTAYPQPGWVEQGADQITDSVRVAVTAALAKAPGATPIGVTLSTQRESMVMWEAATGRPVGPLVSWQDQRTAAQCRELAAAGYADMVLRKSGLPLDPMFSGTRAGWMLDQVDPARRRSRAGQLRLGTVDSWLLFEMTGEHLTESGNASRTQLLDVHANSWDDELLDVFGVPREALATVTKSAGSLPSIRGFAPLPDGTPVLAVLADSHAALFAHGVRTPGAVKSTYGTGSSVMGLCGRADEPPAGLCLTVAWDYDEPVLAVEGNIRSSGATLGWLARLLDQDTADLAELAETVPDTGGVTLVPAFTGLGSPWWDDRARGTVVGLTLGTTRAHLSRAALESTAHQVSDVLDRVAAHVGGVGVVLTDGGGSANRFLMQLQADISGVRVAASSLPDLSALGAAYLGGLQAGVWSEETLHGLERHRPALDPSWDQATRESARTSWRCAIDQAKATWDGHDLD